MITRKTMVSIISSSRKIFTSQPHSKNSRVVNIECLFRKGIGLKPDTYEKLGILLDGKFTGNLPQDILSSVIKNSKNKDKKIKEIQSAFAKVSEILGEFTKTETEAYKKVKSADFDDKKMIKQALDTVVSLKVLDLSDKTIEIFKKAEKTLKKSFSGILPKNTTVKITDIGSGVFGDVFKISFLDKKGNKVFKDIALKRFKTPQESYRNGLAKEKFLKKEIAKYTDYELSRILRNCYPNASSKELGIKKLFLRTLEESNKKYFWDAFYKSKASNGILAEANNSEFVRFHLGRKLTPKDNLVIPTMFGFCKNAFCISEYVSPNAQLPSREINLWKLNIRHKDLSAANLVRNRIIDLGGITHFVKSFQTSIDATTIKFLKKLLNVEIEAIEKLEENILNMKNNKYPDLSLVSKFEVAKELSEDILCKILTKQ